MPLGVLRLTVVRDMVATREDGPCSSLFAHALDVAAEAVVRAVAAVA